ncbi:nitrate/nitrite transporter [Terrilactibacillus laevilacticus]|uniref:Nitrate/nitrite transporter n=1 Tax=Terrilactibacillus laevilacticus TaxID=1380157 RepID=A0ABW5PUS9_9BACI|nr:nitrate/nitrite transporter [Terrilactibacillus laevilacticus]
MKLADLKNKGHLPSLIASLLYFDVSFMIWVILGALGAFIVQDFGLTPAQMGLIVALPALGGSIFRIAMGILCDLVGPRKTAIGGMLITLIPLLWGWLSGHQFSELVCIGILLGVAGGSFTASLPLASRWYPPQLQGLVMGIAGAGNSGTVFATLFAPRLAEKFGWHNVLGLAIIPLLLIFVAYILMAKDAPSQPKPKPIKDYIKLFKVKDAWVFCILYAVTFGGYVGLTSFLSAFFVSQYGIPKVSAGDSVTLCVLVGSVFRPLGGFIADRFGGTNVLKFVFAGLALSMFGVSFLPTYYAMMFLLIAVMVCLGMGNGAVFQIVPQRFGKEIGTITGIVGAAGGVGGFFVPTLLGTLKQTTGTYTTGFLCFAIVGLIVLGVLLLAVHSWRKSWMKNSQKDNQTINVS